MSSFAEPGPRRAVFARRVVLRRTCFCRCISRSHPRRKICFHLCLSFFSSHKGSAIDVALLFPVLSHRNPESSFRPRVEKSASALPAEGHAFTHAEKSRGRRRYRSTEGRSKARRAKRLKFSPAPYCKARTERHTSPTPHYKAGTEGHTFTHTSMRGQNGRTHTTHTSMRGQNGKAHIHPRLNAQLERKGMRSRMP